MKAGAVLIYVFVFFFFVFVFFFFLFCIGNKTLILLAMPPIAKELRGYLFILTFNLLLPLILGQSIQYVGVFDNKY